MLAHGSGPSSLSFALPPAELVQQLVNAYFTQVNEQQPILHWPSFERDLVGDTASKDATFRSLRQLQLGAVRNCPLTRCPQSSSSSPSAHAGSVTLFSRSTGPPRGSTGHLVPRLKSVPSVPRAPPSTTYKLPHCRSSTSWVRKRACRRGTQKASPVSRTGVQRRRPSLTPRSSVRKFIDIGAHLDSTERWTQSPLVDQLRKRAFHALHVADREFRGSAARKPGFGSLCSAQVSSQRQSDAHWPFRSVTLPSSTRFPSTTRRSTDGT